MQNVKNFLTENKKLNIRKKVIIFAFNYRHFDLASLSSIHKGKVKVPVKHM